MKKLILPLLIVLSGCAATPSNELPAFAPSLLGGSKDIALVFEASKQNQNYGINQTGTATGGLIGAKIDHDNTSNSTVFTKAAFAHPQFEDLYAKFGADLSAALNAQGYQTFKARHAYSTTAFDPAATHHGDREWVIYVENAFIQYYATTILSSYKPKISAYITPYNTKTKVLYKPLYLDFTMNNPTSFATAAGVLENIPHSFEGLKQNTKAAAAEAARMLTGSAPTR
jgi:hypothetical protein